MEISASSVGVQVSSGHELARYEPVIGKTYVYMISIITYIGDWNTFIFTPILNQLAKSKSFLVFINTVLFCRCVIATENTMLYV